MPSPTTDVIAPGVTVVVRDEEWLVTSVDQTNDGQLLHVQGLGALVKGTTASFYESLDDIQILDPAQATLTPDSSPGYRRAKLWLEATLRKTPVPLSDDKLVVSTQMLADPLAYQQSAVRKALSPDNLRTRILLADAVGLGKTLEIGMILAELVRRGRGDRILIVCPRHVLEQMQHEMWTRFALPFVRLDSVGVQRVKQKLPATRNPFTFYRRVIISIDTLKQDRFANDLRGHRWDAVVIDESHNVTNSATQNNRLARILAPSTDALILASATPHNGREESFAELIRLLEPTAVTPDGRLRPEEVERLVVRRHRHSPEVANVVGADWAERKEPQNILVPASPEEDAVADELDRVWLHPRGSSPYSGKVTQLFPWTLAKAFLSSPAALRASIHNRIRTLQAHPTTDRQRELDALHRLDKLNDASYATAGGKYGRLVSYLRRIGVAKNSTMRAVIFAERVDTLRWLRERLRKEFGMTEDQVQVLHGGLSDVEQQEIVESFKQSGSPIRVLVTGDVASEGVNLHKQCHELIHYDIPWSLIRLEQRNGRIDRYGQKTPPQITTLLLQPSAESFSGDLVVLTKLLEREEQAHTTLGDAASLMGKYSVEAEEEEIRKVLAGQQDLDEVVADVQTVATGGGLAGLLARLGSTATTATAPTNDQPRPLLYTKQVDFLRDALQEAFRTPAAPKSANGVAWKEYPQARIAEFTPPDDLRQRLEVLPGSYLAERKVLEDLKLVTTTTRGQEILAEALADTASRTSWPEAHYLGPLHPVLDWAADQALASLSRNEVFAVRGTVEYPTVLLVGTLTNKRGQVVSAAYMAVEFSDPDSPGYVTPYAGPQDMLQAVGLTDAMSNPGGPAGTDELQRLMSAAVRDGRSYLELVYAANAEDTQRRVDEWVHRTDAWMDAYESDVLIKREEVKQRRIGVAEEKKLLVSMAPDRQLLRPLAMVLPTGHPVAPPSSPAAQPDTSTTPTPLGTEA